MKAIAAHTARLVIEPLRAAHAPLLFPLLADPRLYLYAPNTSRATLAGLLERFAQLEAGAPEDADETWLNWVLRRRDGGAAVGTLQATLKPSRPAWIGYALVPSAWGQGLASEACVWLLADLSRRRGVRDVRASVDVRNAKSIALLERLGFVRVRTEPAELNGEPTTDHLYRLVGAP